jgi:hypothetical protein
MRGITLAQTSTLRPANEPGKPGWNCGCSLRPAWPFCQGVPPRHDATPTSSRIAWIAGWTASAGLFGMRPSKLPNDPTGQQPQPLMRLKSSAAEQQTCDLAQRGLPGQAVQRLTGAKIAPDTAEVERIMRSKFVDPLPHQAASSRPLGPAANELSEDAVLQAVRSFKRPDFLRQVVGEAGPGKQGLSLLTSFLNLLADGRAPTHLQAYIGGARGTALDKKSKQGEQDARPICSGEVWRRVVGKALLAGELPALRVHLLPHQLAVGVPAGAEVLPHVISCCSPLAAGFPRGR